MSSNHHPQNSRYYVPKDLVEPAISEGITDDILSKIDEASQADEYDDGPIYDNLEVLIKEAEEQKDRMSPPFQYTKTPYDILDVWEHNDENYEEDGYWTFMGPPFYDSLRPGSIIFIGCSKEEQLDELT